jgi:hypothetical protein
MKLRVFKDIAPCSLGVDQHFREVCTASIVRAIIALMMEAVLSTDHE